VGVSNLAQNNEHMHVIVSVPEMRNGRRLLLRVRQAVRSEWHVKIDKFSKRSNE
jgi:hypothetical protein